MNQLYIYICPLFFGFPSYVGHHSALVEFPVLYSMFSLVVYFFLKFFFKINLFIYFWLRWVFVAARGPPLVVVSGGHSSLQCTGFSLRWPLFVVERGPQSARASVVVARGLSGCGSQAPERRLSSCGAWAQSLHGMWDPPRPGLKPMSPALAGRLPTTAPPGKSLSIL